MDVCVDANLLLGLYVVSMENNSNFRHYSNCNTREKNLIKNDEVCFLNAWKRCKGGFIEAFIRLWSVFIFFEEKKENGFTPYNVKQPLQGMKNKEDKKIKKRKKSNKRRDERETIDKST